MSVAWQCIKDKSSVWDVIVIRHIQLSNTITSIANSLIHYFQNSMLRLVASIKSYNTDNHAYTVEFHLKEKTTDMWQLIQDATTTFNTDYKSINGAILKHVATLFADGFYDYFIERYEYDLKCFDIGNNALSEDLHCKCPACKRRIDFGIDTCPYCETHIVWSDDE